MTNRAPFKHGQGRKLQGRQIDGGGGEEGVRAPFFNFAQGAKINDSLGHLVCDLLDTPCV